jgi:RNA polymerase sigma-70 factor (ECF subfamily)
VDYSKHSDAALLVATPSAPEAFGAFYARHERAVLGYFFRRGSSADVAIDLTAETFAAALIACRRFKPGPAPASAWLFGIARYVLAQSHRRGLVEDRARRRLGMPPLALTDELLERVDDVVGRDDNNRVLRLVDELPPERRDALNARVVDDRSYREIAAELGCSEAVVRKRVSRALTTLRGRLEAQ